MNKTSLSEQSLSSPAESALSFAAENAQFFEDELKDFLRIPSIGTQQTHHEDTIKAAEWLVEHMNAAGVENVKLIETSGMPLIYGDNIQAGPDAKTVLIYGHYDVQPVDPLDEWATPPFEPTLQEDYLYARGASDDKGQLYIHVKSIESFLKGAGVLPVNVKFIFEGEEESGGASLASFIPNNQELLSADVALISDTHMLSIKTPSIVYGLRGICYAFLDIKGPEHDLHSGSYGGAIDNPLNVLAHIVAKLKDEAGHIQIPGFYDSVKSITELEQALLAESPLDEADLLSQTSAPQLWGEPEFTLIERLGARPTLDVNGMVGGYTGDGAKTVLPSSAHAKISMRLVPDQDPGEIFKLFQSYVSEVVPPTVQAECTLVHGAPPSIVDYESTEMLAGSLAYEAVFGQQPVLVREGGGIPAVSLFKNHLRIETILMGFGLPDDRIHGPNERFYLPNFHRGIRTVIHFLDIYSKM